MSIWRCESCNAEWRTGRDAADRDPVTASERFQRETEVPLAWRSDRRHRRAVNDEGDHCWERQHRVSGAWSGTPIECGPIVRLPSIVRASRRRYPPAVTRRPGVWFRVLEGSTAAVGGWHWTGAESIETIQRRQRQLGVEVSIGGACGQLIWGRVFESDPNGPTLPGRCPTCARHARGIVVRPGSPIDRVVPDPNRPGVFFVRDPEPSFTPEQVLADVQRAVRGAFPDRADDIMTMIEGWQRDADRALRQRPETYESLTRRALADAWLQAQRDPPVRAPAPGAPGDECVHCGAPEGLVEMASSEEGLRCTDREACAERIAPMRGDE